MLVADVSGAGGGTLGGPTPGPGTERSSGEPAVELPDTEARDAVLVNPGRQTDCKSKRLNNFKIGYTKWRNNACGRLNHN